MPNQFNGQVFDSNGNKLEKVTVSIVGTGVPPHQTTETDSQGKWLITLNTNTKSEDLTVTFSKPGLETTTIKNPQPTAVIQGYIDPIKGGTLDLAGDYDSGKWKISSLKPESQLVLDQEIKDLYNFAKNNPGNFTLTIEASESHVPNHDNEEGKTREKEFQTPGALAKARATNLYEYVDKKINELYSKETDKNFSKPIIILGKIDNVGGPAWDGKYDERYKPFQNTRLIANLINPISDCVYKQSEPSDSYRGSKSFNKTSRLTKITLDAADAPDRFGIESKSAGGKLNNYYTQSPKAVGNLITWKFIMFLGSLPDKTKGMTSFLIDKNLLKTSLLEDYKIPVIRDNIVAYAKDKIYHSSVPTDANKLIDDIISFTGGRGYEIKREETIFPLTNIPDNTQFSIIAINGSYIGGSAWRYKLCD
jgi:hypothetical protein